MVLLGNNEDDSLGTNPEGHSGAVISLNLNKVQKQILASGSEDCTVKLWDLSNGKVGRTHNCGGNRPENIIWHPNEASILFVATEDNTIQAADIRAPKIIGKYKFDASIESICFDQQNQKELHLSFDNGHIAGLDITKDFKTSYQLKVSKKSCSSISMSPGIEGLMSVTGLDSKVYTFNSKNRDEANCPVLIDRLLTQGVSDRYFSL